MAKPSEHMPLEEAVEYVVSTILKIREVERLDREIAKLKAKILLDQAGAS